MSTGYSSRIWVCPFFRWDKRRQVYCEGGTVSLPDLETFQEFVNTYCAADKGWENCAIAKAMTEYYDRTGALPPE